MVDAGTMDSLLGWLNQLIEKDPPMLNSLLDAGLLKNANLTDGKIDLLKLDAASHSNTFALGVGHWILHSLFENDPKWRVDMLPQYGYHVALKDQSCDMLSLGFYCKKLAIPIPRDPLGLAVLEQAPGPDIDAARDKCYDNILRRVKESGDVDVKLYNNETLYTQCLDESSKLLASARYDESEYRKFAEADRLKLSDFLKESGLV
jgi:hypothetical protein